MDKKGRRIMRKTYLLSACLFILAGFACGCETSKVLATGLTSGTGAVAKGVSTDVGNLWQGIKKSDDWIRTNLW